MLKNCRIITLNHDVGNVVGNVYLEEEIEELLTEGVSFMLSASVMLSSEDGKKNLLCVDLTPMPVKEGGNELEERQIFKHS